MLNEAFKGTEARFSSRWTEKEALSRLSSLIKWKPNSPPIVGQVTASRIELRLARAFVRSNGTVFRGQLETEGEEMSLVGTFAVSTFYRWIGSIFLIVLLFMACGGVVGGLAHTFSAGLTYPCTLYLLGGVALFLLGCFLFAALIIWNLTPDRKVVAVLSNGIQRVLSDADMSSLASKQEGHKTEEGTHEVDPVIGDQWKLPRSEGK